MLISISSLRSTTPTHLLVWSRYQPTHDLTASCTLCQGPFGKKVWAGPVKNDLVGNTQPGLNCDHDKWELKYLSSHRKLRRRQREGLLLSSLLLSDCPVGSGPRGSEARVSFHPSVEDKRAPLGSTTTGALSIKRPYLEHLQVANKNLNYLWNINPLVMYSKCVRSRLPFKN